MRIAIDHITRYRYATEASYSVQTLRMTPMSFVGQRVVEWGVDGQPACTLTPTRDGFGNTIHLMTVTGPHSEVVIRAKGVVDVEDRHGIVNGIPETVPMRVWLRRTELTAPNADIARIADGLPGDDTIARLHSLMARIREQVEYRTGKTDATTTAAQALAAGEGVCQDHAHIFISAARSLAIPARYVTGYLAGDDSAASFHAWAECWDERLGWIGFDAMFNLCPADTYIRLAAGLDAMGTMPLRCVPAWPDMPVETVEMVVT